MRKAFIIVLTGVTLLGLVAPLSGCKSEQQVVQAQENRIATVQRGDLTVEITAAGNLALSSTEDLTFDLFYQQGTVAEVLVQAGDSVEEGQVLARLDQDEWREQLKALEKKMVTAERNLTARESAVTKAESNVAARERAVTQAELQVSARETAVTRAERDITAKGIAVRDAELTLQSAENGLSNINDVKKIQDRIDNAEYTLKFAQSVLNGEFGGGLDMTSSSFTYWSQLVSSARDERDSATRELQEVLSGSSVRLSDDVLLQVAESLLLIEKRKLALEDAEIAVDSARQAVIDAQLDVADAIQSVKDAETAVEDARQAVRDAQLDVEEAREAFEDALADLNEAKGKSPDLTAPFAGFVTRVNIEGGDEVLRGTVAVQVADPGKFNADIMVGEMDILQVNLDGEANVSVDALSGLTLPAKVTHISPTATIQQGVVNYKVKVEVASVEEMRQQAQAARQNMQSLQPGEIPERLQQAIDEGRMTREQVEQMMQGQPAQAGAQSQTLPITAQNFQLKEGMSVTVSVTIEEVLGVLLVPNAAITSRAGQTSVKVVMADGTMEERVIQVGIADWQYTEVTGGLSEGEQVIVPEGTTVTTTTTTQGRQGGMFLPGMGGPR